MPLGAVGTVELVTLGDTLKDLLRGPEGANGGGVCTRGRPGNPLKPLTSDLGEAKGGLGDTDASAGDIRVARGPVGAASSPKREVCAGCTGGCMIVGSEVADIAGEAALGPEGIGLMKGSACSTRETSIVVFFA